MSKNSDPFNELRNQVKEKKEKSKAKDEKNDVNNNGDVNGDGDSNSNKKITLSKGKNKPKKIKRTYYIYEENDEKISKLARESGKDKSELIRIAIDFLYDNVDIK